MEKHSMYKKNVSIIISLLLLTSLLSIATIPIVSAAEATIQPSSADSYMNEGAKNTNYGGQSYIEVSSKPSAWGSARGIIEFDLSSIPSGSTITSVTLSLYLYSTRGYDRTYCLHKVTKNWTESGVTWNKYDGTNNWTTSGGDYAATASATVTAGAVYNTWVEWSSSTLASDVSDFVNNPSTNFGWIIKDQTEGSSNQDWVRFYSKEHTDSTLRPKLAVTYSGEPDTTPPAAPTGLAATAVSTSQIDLDWNNNTEGDLDHYNVYRSTTSGFTPDPGNFVTERTVSNYSDTGLSAGTTYYYKVTAVDTSGNESDPSAEASATTEAPDTTPPAAPTGLTATAVSSSQIDLDWNNNTEGDLDYYNVYRSTTSGFTPGPGNFVTERTVSNYSDTGLSAGTTYYYKVTAVDTSGNESDPSAEASATTEAPDTTPPAAPTGLTATAVSTSQIDLDWANNTEGDLDHYNVYRSTTSGFTPGPGNFVTERTVSNYSDTGLSASTTYYYKVTAVDTSGNESDPSAQASATTQAAPVAVWNFECHSYTHPQSITASELQQVNDAFAAHGLPEPLHHAYPFGNVNQSVCSQYRLSGRTVGGIMETQYPVPNWYQLKATEIQSWTAWSTIQGWVDQCISQVGMLHIFSHRVQDPAPQYGMTPAMLNQLLDYLVTKQNAGQLTVMTMRDAYDAWNGTAPIVVISFDDGWLSDYDTTWPIFKEHGLVGTSYIYPQPMDEMWTEFVSWALVEEMAGLREPRPAPGPSVTRAGVRESMYDDPSIDPFPSAEEWTNDMNTMASYWTGSQPTGVWVVGILDVPENQACRLQFPEPAGGPYANITFESTDMHESYLDYFDTHGIDVWLQIEPAFADMNTLIDLVFNQYGHHSCVKGFGVDCEWYRYTLEDDWGVPVTDANAQSWESRVKSHNANYTLFLKHFNYTWLPPSYRGDIIFVSDSQDFNWEELTTPGDKLDAMVYEFTIHWAPWFYPNPVWFQIGYELDKNWWQTLANPPKDIGDAIDAETTQATGIFWVDFTLRDIFPAPPDTTPPAAPTSLTATAIGPSQIDLDWANNTETDLDHYSVYRSTTSGFTPGTGTFVASTTVSNYSDTGLSAETTYYYKVTAEDTSGNESDPSAQASATTLTPDTTPPAAPTGLTATAVSSSRIDLDWANNTETDLWKYSVYRSTTSGFTPGTGTFVAETTVSNYSDTGLSAETTYYYKVTAVDTSGNESSPSSEASATTQAGAPSMTHAGVRESTYGISPFPSAEEWENDMKKMASYWTGSQPTGIWNVGVMWDPNDCHLEFPGTSTDPNILFSDTDFHEPYFDYFDTHGIDVWLQVEPADADVETLIDLVLNQYGHHSCVKGFGVDVEWYEYSATDDFGVPVTDAEAEAWESAVKSHSANYTLYLKHFYRDWMPPNYRGDIIFNDDYQICDNLSDMVAEFADNWAPFFYPNPVWFQVGYEADRVWWENLANPPKDIGDALDEAIPNDMGIFWVDFTLRDAFPPSPDNTPPVAPSGLITTAVSSSRIDLDWANNTEIDLDHYSVYRSTTSGFTPGTGNFVASTTVSAYSDTGLSASTTYYYKVTAVDLFGNESSASSEASATTKAGPPPTVGWDFEGHTHTHPYLTQLTEAGIQSQLEQVNSYFQANLGYTPEHHSYPYGDYNATVKSVVAEYRLTGRCAWDVDSHINTYPMADRYQMNAMEIQNTTAVSEATGWIDEAITNNALLNIFTHRVMESPPQYACTPATLRAVCDYLLAKQNAGQLTVLPMRDAYISWDGTKAVVVLGFDDGYATDYTTTWPILRDEYGFIGTSYIYTAGVGMSWAQMQEMAAGPADNTPPAAPTGLTATAIGPSQIDLDWANNTEADLDHYSVYRSTTSGFTPGTGNFVANTTVSAYLDTGLSASTTYYYKVTAVDTSNNESSASSEASATTQAPDTTPPAAPTGLTATAVSSSQINLDWANNTEADLWKYNVYRSTTSGFTPGTGTFVAETTVSSYSDTGLSAETTYYYKVTAVDTSGNESDPSAQASATTQAPPAGEVHVEALLATDSSQSNGIYQRIFNDGTSAISGFSAKYFMDLTEVYVAGYSASNLVFNIDWDQSGAVTVSGPTAYDVPNYIYYYTMDYGTYSLGAGSSTELRYRIHLNDWSLNWDSSNDWSRTGLTNVFATTTYIPVYKDGALIYGNEP